MLRAKSAKFCENLNLYSSSSSFHLSRTTSPATSLILRLPTTADVFGYLHRRASHIDNRHSFFVRTIIDWNRLEDDIVDTPTRLKRPLPGTLSEHSTWLPLHNLISVQSTGRTRSSSLVTLAWPSFSLGLQITNRSLHMHHLTCGISSLLHYVNIILFTLLLVHLILRISPHLSHHLRSHHSLDLSLQTLNSSLSQILSSSHYLNPSDCLYGS